MAETPFLWMSSLGGPSTVIEADFDEDFERVYVDDANLNLMAASLLLSGPLGPEDDRATALAILNLKHDGDGASPGYDVTEVGGGWGLWVATRDDVTLAPGQKVGYDV